MRITPGAQPLQTLKAQQAWEARRAAKTTGQQQAPIATPSIEIAKPDPIVSAGSQASPSPAGTSPWASPQWTNKVQEIQTIAEKSGFIGVSEQDIRRAYSQGSSLLADYRV